MSHFGGMPRTVYETQKEQAKNIGKRERWARELVGLTPTELAADIGIDTTAIRHIERGVRLPSIHVLMSLCHTLRVSPQYLLWGSLEGVNQELAVRLKQLHPELLSPGDPLSPGHSDSNPGYTSRRPRTRAHYYGSP